MRKFIALDKEGRPTAFVPGIACRDYTEEEWRELVKSGAIVEGSPAAALWEKGKDEVSFTKKDGKDGD